jgi:hypothetical protein
MLSSLSVETFADVSALDMLDLRYIKIQTIDINILKALTKLSTLYLYDNLLHCDSQLQEVWRWCEDRNIRTVYDGRVPKCDIPSEVKKMWWGVLEKGQCLEGKIYSIMETATVQASFTLTLTTSTVTNMITSF